MRFAIKVEGLSEFQRNLKKLDNDLPKVLRMALNEVADTLVTKAKPKVPRRSGRAAGSMRAQSTQTRARVKAGGARVPYYPWLDFGGSVGKRDSVKRPFRADGRYLYPTFFGMRNSGEVQEALADALVKVARQSGIEVTNG